MIIAEIKIKREDGTVLLSYEVNALSNFTWFTTPMSEIVDLESEKNLAGFQYFSRIYNRKTGKFS